MQCDLLAIRCCVIRGSFKIEKFVFRKVPTSVQESQSVSSNSKVTGAPGKGPPKFPVNVERRSTLKER